MKTTVMNATVKIGRMAGISKALTFTAALLALLHIAPRAEAAAIQSVNVTLNSQGPNGGGDVNVQLYEDSGTRVASFNLSQGGAMDWTFNSGTKTDHSSFSSNPFDSMDGTIHLVPPQTFNSFCVDVTQGIGLHGTYTYQVQDLSTAPQPASGSLSGGMGTTAAMEIKQLWTLYFHTINASSDPNSTAAAFQLAMWKLEYDQGQIVTNGTFNDSLFGSGHLRAGESPDPILDTAASMITAVEDNPNTAQANLFALVSGGINQWGHPYGAQDQVVEIPGGSGGGNQNQVPEPATALMCLLGCACCGARRLRRAVAACR